jgi:hypothetical protein
MTNLVLSTVLPMIAQPSPTAPPGADRIQTILSWAMWIVVACAVLGLLLTAGMMVLSHMQGRSQEHMGRLGYVMAGMVIAGGAATMVNTLLL